MLESRVEMIKREVEVAVVVEPQKASALRLFLTAMSS